jgi:Protein of unknown function (DUF3592)
MDSNTVVLIVFGLAVVFALASWIHGRIRRHHALAWPKIEGKVVSREVKLQKRPMLVNGVNTTEEYWEARVTYTYSVQGTDYTGKVSKSFKDGVEADDWASDYKEGRTLAVRQNPAKPSDSELIEKEQEWMVALEQAS